MLIRSLETANDEKIKLFIIKLLSPHFNFPLDNRITVKSDINQFRWQEDKHVFLQKRGKAKQNIEIYWDNVWVCDIIEGATGEMIISVFLRGFLQLYKDDKVHVNEVSELEKIRTEQIIVDEIKDLKKKAQDKRNARAGSTEESMSNEAVARIIDDKVAKKEVVRKYRKLKGEI